MSYARISLCIEQQLLLSSSSSAAALFITFMLGIDNYIPETNHVSRVYVFIAILL
jgi:hypothetical protein